MRIPHKWLWLVLLVLCAACRRPEDVPGQSTGASVAGSQPCELVVGWDPWEPYQYETADGRLAGLDIELVQNLAGEAACELDFAQGNWADHLDAVREGRVDLLLAATPNEQRRTFAEFSSPYRAEDIAMFVRSEDLGALSAKTVAQLAAEGHRIAVTDAYYYGAEVANLMADAATAHLFRRARIVEAGYAMLVDGQVDALLDDPVVAASVLRRKGWTDVVVRHPIPVSHGEVALMFSRASVPDGVVQRFEAALRKERASGRIASVMARYSEPPQTDAVSASGT